MTTPVNHDHAEESTSSCFPNEIWYQIAIHLDWCSLSKLSATDWNLYKITHDIKPHYCNELFQMRQTQSTVRQCQEDEEVNYWKLRIAFANKEKIIVVANERCVEYPMDIRNEDVMVQEDLFLCESENLILFDNGYDLSIYNKKKESLNSLNNVFSESKNHRKSCTIIEEDPIEILLYDIDRGTVSIIKDDPPQSTILGRIIVHKKSGQIEFVSDLEEISDEYELIQCLFSSYHKKKLLLQCAKCDQELYLDIKSNSLKYLNLNSHSSPHGPPHFLLNVFSYAGLHLPMSLLTANNIHKLRCSYEEDGKWKKKWSFKFREDQQIRYVYHHNQSVKEEVIPILMMEQSSAIMLMLDLHTGEQIAEIPFDFRGQIVEFVKFIGHPPHRYFFVATATKLLFFEKGEENVFLLISEVDKTNTSIEGRICDCRLVFGKLIFLVLSEQNRQNYMIVIQDLQTDHEEDSFKVIHPKNTCKYKVIFYATVTLFFIMAALAILFGVKCRVNLSIGMSCGSIPFAVLAIPIGYCAFRKRRPVLGMK